MKLLQEFEKYQSLWNKGFRFNPEEEVFYTSEPRTFKAPLGFESWEVKTLDKEEYLNERLQELGITEEENSIQILDKENKKITSKIFQANKFGDIEIIQFSLKRQSFIYEKSTTSAGTRFEYCVQRRLNPLYTDFTEGKYDFSEAKNTPFWHPELIQDFEEKKEVETLVITEGQFKAYKATKDGIKTVGLTSISHFRDGQTKGLHTEIIEFIHMCKVKKVIILWDADCKSISSKHLENQEELTRRPSQFYHFARSIKDELQTIFSRKKLQIFFATIKDDIITEPKGIDDLLCVKNIPEKDIVKDFDQVGQLPGYYIDWINITTKEGEKAMRYYFNLHSVYAFYNFHASLITNKNFVFYGTTYRVENSVPVVEVDKDLKKYMRIGSDYFRLIQKEEYNKHGDVIGEYEVLTPWKPAEIRRDFGKEALDNVIKLDGFVNVPNNVDYKQIINNKWNLYSEMSHEIKQGDFPIIKQFLIHIFGDQYEYGLDYIQLMYTMPRQKLPVLALVSKEQGTGKSTFLKFLFKIFQSNMTFVTPDDILGDWTSHWVSKLVVASEETFFEKKDAMEKIKNLSTAEKVMRNERFVNSELIDCFLKFVFCSNYEDDFIKLNEDDTRFWIRKINKIEQSQKILNIEDKFSEEMPAFLHYLLNREISYKEKDRMWFDLDDLVTDAYRNIVAHSEPGIIKDLRLQFEEYFSKFQTEELRICVKDLKQYFGAKGNDYYLNKILKEYFKTDKESNASRYEFLLDNPQEVNKPYKIKGRGRYFTFKKKDFV